MSSPFEPDYDPAAVLSWRDGVDLSAYSRPHLRVRASARARCIMDSDLSAAQGALSARDVGFEEDLAVLERCPAVDAQRRLVARAGRGARVYERDLRKRQLGVRKERERRGHGEMLEPTHANAGFISLCLFCITQSRLVLIRDMVSSAFKDSTLRPGYPTDPGGQLPSMLSFHHFHRHFRAFYGAILLLLDRTFWGLLTRV